MDGENNGNTLWANGWFGGFLPTISVNIHIHPTGSPSSKRVFQKKIPTVSPMTWLPLAGGRTPTAAGGLPAAGLSVSRWVLQTSPGFSLMMNQIITWWFNSWPSLGPGEIPWPFLNGWKRDLQWSGMKFGHELNHLVKNGCFSKHHQLRER